MSGMATMRAMIALGLSDEQKLMLLSAIEEDREPVRSSSAERQRRYRQRQKGVGVTSDVTPLRNDRDVTPPPNEVSSNPPEDLIDEASASSPAAHRQPISAARDFWNENAAPVGWRTITTLSAARQKAAGARLREHGLDGWKAAIARARASPYLGGADPPTWFTFDWLTKAGNFLKLIEGNYDRNRSDHRQPAPSGWGTARDQVRLLSQ